ncbi:MAG: TIGR04551 family protein [Kofleriaceae bacterium]
MKAAHTASSIAAVLVVAIACTGCASFHAGKLPGTPADATFVDVDGISVRYREAGTGPAVVLIHGYGASSDHWAPVIPALAVHHRVIAIDLKGFGWTSRPDGDYSPAAQAQLVWHVLDKLGVTDVAIVGHSWGSSVALSMAVAHPARVRRVALYSAYVYDEQVPSFFRWAEKPGIGEALFTLFYRQRIEDRAPLAYYDERWVTQARVERVEDELSRDGTVAAALAVAREHHFADLHAKLRGFSRPVLLLWGENDEVTPIQYGERLAAELANARLVRFPRCGHIPMVEAHNPSTRELAMFLSRDHAPAVEPAPVEPAPMAPTTTPSASLDRRIDTSAMFAPREIDPISNVDRHDHDHDHDHDRDHDQGGPTSSIAGRGHVVRTTPDRSRSDHVDFLGAADDAVELLEAALASNERTNVLARAGGGGGGDTGGGAGGGAPELDAAVEAAILASAPTRPEPKEIDLPVGADLAALGAELTPRRYAAPREKGGAVIHGSFRLREQGLFNLDLDRGLDSRGQPVYPVPLGGGQMLEAADLRARTDVALYAPGVGVAVKARIDWLDNVALGGQPDLSNGSPATSPGQRPTVVVVKRAWGEVLTPFGVLAAGRMGAHFGLGITANGGDCDDCDKGDAADRIAFVSPIAGHFLAVAWDVAARGPFTQSRDGGHPIALETTDSASGLTFALLKMHSPAALARRADAGRTSVEYGAYVAMRSQERDVPASYLPVATPVTTFTSNDLVARGFSALTTGGWLRVTRRGLRFEAEVTHARADIEQPSLVPGTEIMVPVSSRQLGAAGELELRNDVGALELDVGFASGDDAPGFGAFPALGEAAPMPGAFDGPQANLPSDRTVDNFRFHPDYRIDQILFREIIGTVTDAIYVRPSATATVMRVGKGRLEASAAVIASWAVKSASTPSGESGLGVEIDPELRYATREGFAAAITPAVFLPGPAFDNTMLEAKPAYAVRARLWFVF